MALGYMPAIGVFPFPATPMPTPIEQSAHVFFDPTPAFVEWLRQFPRPVVDVGAGVGRLGRMFGPGMSSIDLHPRVASESPVIKQDALTFDFSGFRTAVIARPNPGSFAGNAIGRALAAGCVVVYVGKASRRVDDLLPFEHDRSQGLTIIDHELDVVAESGERCVVVTIKPSGRD